MKVPSDIVGPGADVLSMTPLTLPESLRAGETDPPSEPLSPRATTFDHAGSAHLPYIERF